MNKEDCRMSQDITAGEERSKVIKMTTKSSARIMEDVLGGRSEKCERWKWHNEDR